jgi:integrase
VFDFSRTIEGRRVRTTKILPRSWNQAQADAFDRQESAKLYAVATRITGADHLIEEAVATYVSERCPQLKHGRGYAMELQELMPFYVGRPLRALSDVCKAIRLRVTNNGKPLAPATIKNKLRYLTAACRYGWKHHGMGTSDPAAGVVVPSVNNARDKYIDRRQMLTLARACDDRPTRAAIRIAFYSGMRLGEIRVAEVIGTAFVLRDSKNGDPRIVPIHPKLRACLRYTMPSRFKMDYHFVKARTRVGMSWLHFHDLRHSAATAMIESGVEVYTVGAVLGHKSAQSTKRYAHHSVGKLATAINSIGRKSA